MFKVWMVNYFEVTMPYKVIVSKLVLISLSNSTEKSMFVIIELEIVISSNT